MSDGFADSPRPRPTPLGAVLLLTILMSFGTGVFWSGVPFIAEHDYNFSEGANFSMFVTAGLIYALVAINAGRVITLIERRLSPRGVLYVLVFGQAAVCIGPWLVDAPWMIWAVTLAMSVLTALLWPVIESYVSAGRGGRRMRFAIGIWNVCWTAAVGLALVAMAPLMRGDAAIARYAIVALAAINLIAALTLIPFRRVPLEPGATNEADAEVTPEYPYLLRSGRLLLPLSYVLMGMIAPLMPYRMEELGVEAELRTPLTATWMFARVVVVAIMWRAAFWHGRWGAMLFGGAAMAAGFFGMLVAPTAWLLFSALGLFGMGQGVIYFAAIYYALTVGRAQVHAAGTHEALIGAGYAAGPLIGFLTYLVVEQGAGISLPMLRIIVVAVIFAAISGFAFQQYIRVRHLRSSGHEAQP